MDMNQWGPRIVDVGEGPAPTDGAFQAANSMTEGFTSNRRTLHEYLQEMARQNPEVCGHPSAVWINTFVKDSVSNDQDKTEDPAEEMVTMSNIRLMFHQQEAVHNERLSKAESVLEALQV